MSLIESFEGWGVDYRPASTSFAEMISERFPLWRHREEFLATVPSRNQDLNRERYGGAFACLWDEVAMSFHLDENDSRRFLLMGSLKDGAKLALDTKAIRRMSVGIFGLYHCGSTNWSKLRPAYFQKIPCSYPEYLNYLVNVDDDRPSYISGG